MPGSTPSNYTKPWTLARLTSRNPIGPRVSDRRRANHQKSFPLYFTIRSQWQITERNINFNRKEELLVVTRVTADRKTTTSVFWRGSYAAYSAFGRKMSAWWSLTQLWKKNFSKLAWNSWSEMNALVHPSVLKSSAYRRLVTKKK